MFNGIGCFNSILVLSSYYLKYVYEDDDISLSYRIRPANQFYMAVYFLFGNYHFLFGICFIILLINCYYIVQTYTNVLRL